jgi:hypothetical protein
MFSDYFDVLMSKIIFLKIKKHNFNVFLNEKHFEKQLQPPSQTRFNDKLSHIHNGF